MKAPGASRARTTLLSLLVLGAIAAAALGGCGGTTKTVSVSSASTTPPAAAKVAPRQPASTPTNPTPPPSTTGTTTTTEASTTPASTPTSTTRTAPEPAFARHPSTEEATGAEVAAAVAVVKSHGYTPNDTAEYHPHQTLQVMIGTGDDSTAGYDEHAFFFLDGKYLGTDASEPSASMRVVSQSETEVAIAYSLYRPHDTLCCPSGGETTVHFQLNDGQLTPLQPIPPAHSATGLSRQ